MSDQPSPSPDLSSIDLSMSFAPAWVKEASKPQDLAKLAARHGADEARGDRPGRRGGFERRDRDQNRRPGSGRPSDRRDGRNRSSSRPAPREEPVERPVEPLGGWQVRFLPHANGAEGLAKQIKSTAKAYSLFDLAHMVLEKSERYQVEFKRDGEASPNLYQLQSDGTLWLSEGAAAAHALSKQLDKYYRKERIAVDPPKGNYNAVAVCGMSGELLGPPNYHGYQDRIREVHTSRFAKIPLDTYRSRIRTERDEALVEKWKEEQSARDVYYPVDTPEGTEPVKLETLAEVERHFRQHYLVNEVRALPNRAIVPGPAALNDSAHSVLALTRVACDELLRFPLPLAHILGEQLAAKGLQIFKAQKNLTFVGMARPRYLDRQVTPVSEKLQAILAYLENHGNVARAEQWKALIELYPAPAEGEDDKRESLMATDLFWLLREGHVVDYAGRGLVATKKPEAKGNDAKRQQPSQ